MQQFRDPFPSNPNPVMAIRKNLGEAYSPLYFLASLGNGGLAVSFFMFLMFMLPHKGFPIPVYEHLVAGLNGPAWQQGLVVFSLAGIVWFSLQHLNLLFWNIREFSMFSKTAAYQQLKAGNAEVQLMALPLTYGMTINVMFILGALFVPGLWAVVEYLFPLALLAFTVVGIYAGVIFLTFFTRVIAHGNFDCERNNSLSQMLSIFAFAMIAVGMSATGAMSHNPVSSGIGIILAIFFTAIAATLGVIKIVLGFRSMLANGINYEASVSLWIVIPILTLLGICVYRVAMGLTHNFHVGIHPWFHLILFTSFLAIQVMFGLLGYGVMKQMGYFRDFISGDNKSVVTFAAICPGVAFVVLGNFFINNGLVSAGMIQKFDLAYFLLYIPFIVVQVQTIIVMFRLNGKLLKAE